MQNWAFDPRKKRWLFEKPISKPLLDDRAYRLIMLENNLQVLLISDRSADQVGMALDVGVGHVSDPKDMPGLAHFCEHLLFMGTTPFPEENAYKQFVKRHGGFTNASTAASTTTYQFSIQAPYLSGAMERFAAFFHSPLFSSSCVGREVLAVDSENSKNQAVVSDGLSIIANGFPKTVSAMEEPKRRRPPLEHFRVRKQGYSTSFIQRRDSKRNVYRKQRRRSSETYANARNAMVGSELLCG